MYARVKAASPFPRTAGGSFVRASLLFGHRKRKWWTVSSSLPHSHIDEMFARKCFTRWYLSLDLPAINLRVCTEMWQRWRIFMPSSEGKNSCMIGAVWASFHWVFSSSIGFSVSSVQFSLTGHSGSWPSLTRLPARVLPYGYFPWERVYFPKTHFRDLVDWPHDTFLVRKHYLLNTPQC